jgi:hypothetical protein
MKKLTVIIASVIILVTTFTLVTTSRTALAHNMDKLIGGGTSGDTTFMMNAQTIDGSANAVGQFRLFDRGEPGNDDDVVISGQVTWGLYLSFNQWYYQGICSVNGVDGYYFWGYFTDDWEGTTRDFIQVWVGDGTNIVYYVVFELEAGNIKGR